MPIGFSYPIDTVIQDADLFLGTKTTRNTVNYPAQSIANYLNINGKISITGQMSFKFVITNGIAGTISFEGGGGNNTLFSNIDNLIVSLSDVSGQQVNVFLDYLIDSEILLAHQNEINSFGNYKITNYTVTGNPGFYSLDLEYIGGNGSIVKDEYYDIVSFNSSSTTPPYILPIASSTVLGGVKIGTGINIAVDGVISVDTDYVPTYRTITINGVDKDLYADRSWDVGDLLSTGSYANPTWITSLAYSKLTGTPTIPTVGTWGVLNYPTWVSGTPFVKMTAAGTFALDTNTYLTSAVTSISATSPITSSGGTTPIISTSMTTNKLIGRYSVGTGVMQEIAIGDGLTLTAGTLTNTATPTPTGYYGAFQDNVTQNAALSNVGYAMIFRTIDLSNGISVVTNGTNLTRITFANTGIYNLQFSSQFQNTDNAQHDVNVWLRLNGTDVSGSSGLISVPARKSAGAGNEGHIIVGWNYVLSVVAGEYYELVWSTSNATHVTMQFYAAGSPPPSAASVIMTVTQQSGIMAGTGITGLGKSGSIQTGAVQTFAVETSGTDFDIVSSGNTQTFNLPTASATNRGALSAADWTTFNNKQNALGYTPVRFIIKDQTQYPTVTGTGETLQGTYFVQANTFSANDTIKIIPFLAEKTGILGTCTMRVRVGSSSTFNSSTVIATYTTGITELWCIMQRSGFTLRGGNIKGMQFSLSRQSDVIATSGVISVATFNPAVDNWFFTSLQLSVGTDSIFQSNFVMTN